MGTPLFDISSPFHHVIRSNDKIIYSHSRESKPKKKISITFMDVLIWTVKWNKNKIIAIKLIAICMPANTNFIFNRIPSTHCGQFKWWSFQLPNYYSSCNAMRNWRQDLLLIFYKKKCFFIDFQIVLSRAWNEPYIPQRLQLIKSNKFIIKFN